MAWTVYDDRDSSTKRIEIAKMGRTVARMYYKDDEALADAHLIAAAPDMKEALKAMLAHSCVADSDPNDKDEQDHAVERMARAALAKSEGK